MRPISPVVLLAAVALAGCAETVRFEPADGAAEAAVDAPDLCPANVGTLAVQGTSELGVIAPFDPNLPLNAGEQDFNRAHRPNAQIVAWSSAELPDPAGGAWVFYGLFLVRTGYLNFEGMGSGLAHRSADGRTVTREPQMLWPAAPQFNTGVTRSEGFVYAYACQVEGVLDASCKLGRAPEGTLTDRAAWTFWDGAAWNPSVDRAAEVVRTMQGMNVQWNRHIGRWLMVYATPLGETAWLRAADRLQGPWSPPVQAFAALHAGDGHVDYNLALMPEMTSPAGCELTVRYDHPTSASHVETRAVRVTLR